MGDSPAESADGFQFLRLAKLDLQFGLLRFRLLV